MIHFRISRWCLWKLGLLKFKFFVSLLVQVPHRYYLSTMKMEATFSTKIVGVNMCPKYSPLKTIAWQMFVTNFSNLN